MSAASKAVKGMVRSHAQMMRLATPHLTTDKRFATVPTPIIDPVMVCVVETGTPK